MSNDAYEKRMAEMDQEFEAWWREEDDTDEPFFYGVSREVAHEIWRVAYRAGGHRPWTQINPTQLAVLRKMLGATQREQLAAFIMAHGMATLNHA